ncbi:MarR family winged helix-turn-helix transcriptional regulator [Streptomyces uncialis]|uniref:MarR family winged helix-turn-helix transcriptional regulator n=1 Tax=Streptomyces uncialis TaxID=1048205 RepID=UPI00364896E3
MSDPAVERARKIVQGRLSAPGPPNPSRTPAAPGNRGGPDGNRPSPAPGNRPDRFRTGGVPPTGIGAVPGTRPGNDADFIGALNTMFSRLRRFDDWLRTHYALNLTELHVLAALPDTAPVRHRGRRTATTARLAEEVELTPGGLTRLADRLIERGLAARVSDPWDGRVKHLTLTAEGIALRDEILPRAGERIRDTCDTQRDLLEQLRRIAEHSAPG